MEEAKEKARRDQAARLDDSFNSGIEQGMEKGKAELVMSMLKNKLNISLISKITGLSEEEINKLKETQKI